jgi:DUF4097 and DUF4098 domain-containing protein YvlB
MALDNEHWGTTFYLEVPRKSGLALSARNGGISLEEIAGIVNMRSENGGFTVRAVSGDVKGSTRNGGLHIELTGLRWDGAGLDLETRNGGVHLRVPGSYSAELEAGTVNGRVQIDFPVMIHAGRQRRFTTTLGAGGAKIRAMTQNGGVTISRN